MKKKILVSILIAITFIHLESYAQSGGVKKAAKSVFTLTTFKSDGTLIGTTHGVFTSNEGHAISPWKPFIDADSAVVIDASGKTMAVECVIGASEIYDICKFKVTGKTTASQLASTTMPVNAEAWLIGYSIKKPEFEKIKIDKVETFMDKYGYYLINQTPESNYDGCPITNAEGSVIGLLQPNINAAGMHSTDCRFADDFLLDKGLAINDPILRQTHIPLSMPDNEDEATIMLVISNETANGGTYNKYIDTYIQKFPQSTDGYVTKAKQYAANKKYQLADNTLDAASQKVANKSQLFAEWSRLQYNEVIFNNDSTFNDWTLDSSEQLLQKAISLDPQDAYKHQLAQIHYAKGDYANAYNEFLDLTKTLHTGETFYEAAQCKAQLKAPQTEILVLLDSAVNACPQPLTSVAAPYVLARGMAYESAEEYRKALNDYFVYDSLLMGRADHQFYYMRYNCGLKIKQYQQALNDIAHAIILNPSQPAYYAEMAQLQLRVNQYDNSIKTCDLGLKVSEDNTDLYIIKGIALIYNKQKKEGLEAFQEAGKRGDERAKEYIEKYK